MRKQTTRLQWQFIRYSLLISFLTAFLIVFIITYEDERGIALLWGQQLFNIPYIIYFVLLIVFIGIIGGYFYAVPIRERIDQLIYAVIRYERGTFSHRIEEIQSEDELGELAHRLNGMAETIEEQVISLQKLSTERVEMQDAIKKTAITEERQRLARDLHDAVSQQLFAISMMTAAIKENVTTENENKQIAMVEQMANTAQAEMRALLLHLRPTHLEGKSLNEGLHTLFLELKQKYQITTAVTIDEKLYIPKGIEDQLFRMIQEAISNVLRHAHATRIEFQLRKIGYELKLRLIDNGIGFNINQIEQGSYGMQTMKERINEIGGTLHIISIVHKGTQIEATVPITWEGKDDSSSLS